MYDTFSMLKGRPMTRKNTDSSRAGTPHFSDAMTPNQSRPMTGSVSGTEIYKHFAKAGELYSSETEVLGAAIRLIMAEKGTVTNKAIILHLINQLECTSDVVQLDVLRKALEMVVGMTPDDSGF